MPDVGEDEAVDRVLTDIPSEATDWSDEEVLHAGLVGIDAVARADVVVDSGVADRGFAGRTDLPLCAIRGRVGGCSQSSHPVAARVLVGEGTLLWIVLFVHAVGDGTHHGMADVVDTERVVILPPRPAIVPHAILILCPE